MYNFVLRILFFIHSFIQFLLCYKADTALKGPSIKDVRTRGGRGGQSKADTCGRRGEGGSGAKCGRPQIQTFTEIFDVCIVSCLLKDNL